MHRPHTVHTDVDPSRLAKTSPYACQSPPSRMTSPSTASLLAMVKNRLRYLRLTAACGHFISALWVIGNVSRRQMRPTSAVSTNVGVSCRVVCVALRL